MTTGSHVGSESLVRLVLYKWGGCNEKGEMRMWSLISVLLLGINKALRTQFAVGPLGCRSNPVKIDWSEVRKEYMARLRGPRGEKILYKRLGSLALPSPFGHLVDVYVVGAQDGPTKRLYIDPSFDGCHEERAPFGYHLSEA